MARWTEYPRNPDDDSTRTLGSAMVNFGYIVIVLLMMKKDRNVVIIVLLTIITMYTNFEKKLKINILIKICLDV